QEGMLGNKVGRRPSHCPSPHLSPAVPGTLRCPLCLSKDGCEDTLEQVCPIGSTHCYNGVLRLRGAHITTNLRVQGCIPQPDCNLLNGTKAVGTLDVSENCGLQLEEITSNLRVQGCMSQPGCNLLNGTQKIGPMDVREDCSPRISERDVGKSKSHFVL
ncbi:CD177 antigen, partial [Cricetulus griseus]